MGGFADLLAELMPPSLSDLGKLAAKMEEKFKLLKERLDRVEARVAALEKRLDLSEQAVSAPPPPRRRQKPKLSLVPNGPATEDSPPETKGEP